MLGHSEIIFTLESTDPTAVTSPCKNNLFFFSLRAKFYNFLVPGRTFTKFTDRSTVVDNDRFVRFRIHNQSEGRARATKVSILHP